MIPQYPFDALAELPSAHVPHRELKISFAAGVVVAGLLAGKVPSAERFVYAVEWSEVVTILSAILMVLPRVRLIAALIVTGAGGVLVGTLALGPVWSIGCTVVWVRVIGRF